MNDYFRTISEILLWVNVFLLVSDGGISLKGERIVIEITAYLFILLPSSNDFEIKVRSHRSK